MSYTVSYVVSHTVGDIIINVPIIADMITAPRSPSYFSPMLVDSTYFSVAFLLLSHFCPHLLVLILFIPCYYFFLSPRISPTFPLQCPPVSSFVAILVEPEAASPRQAPLLAEPRYGSAPIAYGQYAAGKCTTWKWGIAMQGPPILPHSRLIPKTLSLPWEIETPRIQLKIN